MAKIMTADLSPVEAAHYVLETVLHVVVAALAVTAVSTVVVGLSRGEVPGTLTTGTLVLAAVAAVVWNRTTNLGVQLHLARQRAARRETEQS